MLVEVAQLNRHVALLAIERGGHGVEAPLGTREDFSDLYKEIATKFLIHCLGTLPPSVVKLREFCTQSISLMANVAAASTTVGPRAAHVLRP